MKDEHLQLLVNQTVMCMYKDEKCALDNTRCLSPTYENG